MLQTTQIYILLFQLFSMILLYIVKFELFLFKGPGQQRQVSILALQFIHITATTTTDTENNWSSWTHSSETKVNHCIIWEGFFGKSYFSYPVLFTFYSIYSLRIP